eukprot:TRINITY_DN164_c0_g1_i16.p1 TRINITY_DN164_c0_g1~~TRINITY_DN164_c0_g1_i16.p1  ORF type:complete len:358 (+),score=38.94 TRINITY_DN164_c0_g1_i16:403-1476(+)
MYKDAVDSVDQGSILVIVVLLRRRHPLTPGADLMMRPLCSMGESQVCCRCYQPSWGLAHRSKLAVQLTRCKTCLRCFARDNLSAPKQAAKDRCPKCLCDIPLDLFQWIVEEVYTKYDDLVGPFTTTLKTMEDLGMCDDATAELHRLLLYAWFDPLRLHQFLQRRSVLALWGPRLTALSHSERNKLHIETLGATTQLELLIGSQEEELRRPSVDHGGPQHINTARRLMETSASAIHEYKLAAQGLMPQIADYQRASAPAVVAEPDSMIKVGLIGIESDIAMDVIRECVLVCLPHVSRIMLVFDADAVRNEVLSQLVDIGIAATVDDSLANQGNIVVQYDGSAYFQLELEVGELEQLQG